MPSTVFSIVVAPVVGGLVALPFAAIAHGTIQHREPENDGGQSVVIGVLVLLFSLFIAPIWFYVLVVAAPLAVSIYGYASYLCLKAMTARGARFSIKSLLLVFAWLSANLAAWRWAIDSMLAEYATLPTEPPDSCFVATAAARGHRRFVGADRGAPINRQLRWLKAGELVLRHTTPRLHGALRWVYNRLGPRAARLLTNRWLADLAYVGLKPFEWFARLLVGGVARTRSARVEALYRNHE